MEAVRDSRGLPRGPLSRGPRNIVHNLTQRRSWGLDEVPCFSVDSGSDSGVRGFRFIQEGA